MISWKVFLIKERIERMKNFKKIICACLACAMLMSAAILAEGENTAESGWIKAELFEDRVKRAQNKVNLFDEGTEIATVVPPTAEEKEIIKIIADGIGEHKDEIEIPNEYTVSSERLGELYGAFTGYYIQLERPDIIDIPGIRFYGTAERITSIECEYSKSYTEYQTLLIMFNKELNKIKELLNDGMSDVEKVLAVHDYIASNYEYDMRIYSEDENVREQASRNLDTMIVQKTGVCEGYTKLFKFVMDNIGVECVSVPSDENAHIWNKVKINDKWYNIDVTSDDATPNMSSNILHEYFLVSDDTIKQIDEENKSTLHSTWNATKWDGTTPCEVADDFSFRDMLLHKAKGPVVCRDGKWYAVGSEKNHIKSYDVNANTAADEYTASGDYKWYVYGSDKQSWVGAHSSLALFDGKIYFTAPDKVYEFNTETKEAAEVYDFEKENPDKTDISHSYIYGLKISDNVLYAEYSTRPFYTEENGQVVDPIPATLIEVAQTEQPCSYEYKDNEDGTVEITFDISAKDLSVSNIFVAEYADGKLIGMAQRTVAGDKMIITPNDDASEIKTFIWQKKINEPLLKAEPHTVNRQ